MKKSFTIANIMLTTSLVLFAIGIMAILCGENVEYPNTRVWKLTADEVKQYISEKDKNI